ncbi:MAG TPA: hypothetical protein VKT28_01750 [Puia sp.]|nr:hypothetical protein [Puia sp.]
MRTTAIIFNKAWELEPALAALCSPEFRPIGLPFPTTLLSLKDRRPNSTYTSTDPRAVFRFYENNNPDSPLQYEVSIWCIQDMMDKAVSGSDSVEKYRVLPPVLAAYKPDLVMAAGTAGYPMDSPVAGCVVAGSRFFIHDGHPNNTSHLNLSCYETLFPQNVNPAILGLFNPPLKQVAEPLFIKPPVNPCVRPALLASQYMTAVSSLNVLDYGEYAWVDKEAAASFRKVNDSLPIGSIETTHALIRLSSGQPCMFVSAITDSEGRFDIEVNNPQNYICSFNAGVALGNLIVAINNQLTKTPGLSFGL